MIRFLFDCFGSVIVLNCVVGHNLQTQTQQPPTTPHWHYVGHQSIDGIDSIERTDISGPVKMLSDVAKNNTIISANMTWHCNSFSQTTITATQPSQYIFNTLLSSVSFYVHFLTKWQPQSDAPSDNGRSYKDWIMDRIGPSLRPQTPTTWVEYPLMHSLDVICRLIHTSFHLPQPTHPQIQFLFWSY